MWVLVTIFIYKELRDNMIKFDYYFYREEEDPKLFIKLDWFTFEDEWRQRYLFSTPKYDEKTMEKWKVHNENRHRRFRISLNLNGLRLTFDYRLNKVGNVYFGRLMDEGAKVKKYQERKAKRGNNG